MTATKRAISDTTNGTARRLPGIPGVCRRWTPSGVTTTRRNATTDAATPMTGISSSRPIAGRTGGRIDWGNHVASSSGILATSGRATKNSPIPADDSHDRHGQGLDRRQRRHLRRRGTDQAERGQPLLAPRGGQPGRGGDEDRDRHQRADDGQHDHQHRDRRDVGGRWCRVEADDRRCAELVEGRGRQADDRDELIGGPQTRLPHRPDDRPDPIAELVGGHGLEQRGERRRDDGLTRTGDLRHAGWRRGIGGEPGHQDADQRLALEAVDVGTDEQVGALGRAGLGHDEARAPCRPLRPVVQGGQERQGEQQDRRPDRDRERRQGKPDGRAAAATQRESESQADHDASAPLRRPSRTMISRCGVRGDARFMGHQDDRGTLFGGGLGQQLHDVLAGEAVERARRLVGEDDRRLDDEGARDRHALGLTAGHLAGHAGLRDRPGRDAGTRSPPVVRPAPVRRR